ncbi:MAG: hypothetical protein JRI23_28145 [Deltaproteobacteria bacterium]|jgi:hypothetical protein|nr:hypothetical protein [Deltaproteobacteria bacterium]MBW2535963.1 hypothetical protein [Deltaproteobacteria bacterium]
MSLAPPSPSRHESPTASGGARLDRLALPGLLGTAGGDGLASGLWTAPSWVIVGLGACIVVGVVAYLVGRRLVRRRTP